MVCKCGETVSGLAGHLSQETHRFMIWAPWWNPGPCWKCDRYCVDVIFWCEKLRTTVYCHGKCVEAGVA